MSQSVRYVLVSLLVLLAAAAGFYALRFFSRKPSAAAAAQDSIAAAKEANSAGLSPAAAAAASTTAAAPFPNTYRNAAYGFSFKYPSSLKVSSTASGSGGDTILAQDAAEHVGFQVYITPYAGADTALTAARVEQDLPNISLRSPQQVTIAGSVPALAFFATDPSFGESRQVWFIYKGNLYQASTYSSQSPLLGKVLGTWTFAK